MVNETNRPEVDRSADDLAFVTSSPDDALVCSFRNYRGSHSDGACGSSRCDGLGHLLCDGHRPTVPRPAVAWDDWGVWCAECLALGFGTSNPALVAFVGTLVARSAGMAVAL